MFSFARTLYKHSRARLARARWHRRLPKLPQAAGGKRLLHIGCGEINSPAFINLDARPLPHVHLIRRDFSRLPMIPDQALDMVYMSHVLEHVPRTALSTTIREMARVLKPDGVLRISVPDFDCIVQLYEAAGHDIQAIASPLMGGQDYAYNFHYSVFNRAFLTSMLERNGFQAVDVWDPARCEHHDFEDWASRSIHYGEATYPISLNLEALKR